MDGLDTGRFSSLFGVSPFAALPELAHLVDDGLMSVTDDDGAAVTWHVEMEAPQRLQREFGWNRTTVTPGTKISVTGRRVKSGAPNINVTERARIFIVDDCEEIYHSRDLEPLPERPASCE